MFDNLGTALVQALGFFAIFGFFVYQTLFADRKPKNSKLNPKKISKKKYNSSSFCGNCGIIELKSLST